MNKLDRNKWAKYGFASFIAWVFIAFVAGWLFLIPAAVVVFLIYGLIIYMKERKHRIAVTIKPTEAMRALARREAELRKEKEKILYEEFQDKTKL